MNKCVGFSLNQRSKCAGFSLIQKSNYNSCECVRCGPVRCGRVSCVCVKKETDARLHAQLLYSMVRMNTAKVLF